MRWVKGNDIRVRGEVAYITLRDRDGEKVGVTKVDTEDLPTLRERTWSLNQKLGYVQTNGRGGERSNIYLHRLLCGTHGTKQWTDHRNGDKLDNRKSNLRAVSASLSNINKRTSRGRLKGVHSVKYGGEHYGWQAQVTKTFRTQEAAIKWRREVTKIAHGIEFIEASENIDR